MSCRQLGLLGSALIQNMVVNICSEFKEESAFYFPFMKGSMNAGIKFGTQVKSHWPMAFDSSIPPVPEFS